ncbi:glycoside hydrolase family 27 protein [Lentisphaera marina]|uniref:glycoside hydrolase family 27 protein n=1 Tax=Lentisphaera marina TaxID=1111041 RepID=UPI0023651F96|nr:glycoside hydrolase family 27 protein [Lentisphaera marina]MDD7983517.1 glycoside hydrolase family 27 protein [Lentisphaera marina]
MKNKSCALAVYTQLIKLTILGGAIASVKLNASQQDIYDARIKGKEILTPKASPKPKITSTAIFGVRPGNPIRFRVSATGEKPIEYSAQGLPEGVTIDEKSGWINGLAPGVKGDVVLTLSATNIKGKDKRKFILRVGDTICLTPPMGWNSWYVHSEGVSDKAIREIASSMEEKGLADYGWTYVNIDDCWMGERDPNTQAIQPNGKFGDMKQLVAFVNEKGFKLGLYSTPWMSTYAGYIGGSSPNKEGDYSEFYLSEIQRQNPYQVFGRYPHGIVKNLCKVGDVWLVGRDAQQFADWGIDYVKYDWKEWTLEKNEKELAHILKKKPHLGENALKGYWPSKKKSIKTPESGITKRVHDNFYELERDIILSLSPKHEDLEDTFVSKYCNLWRLTGDIHADWKMMIAPFQMEKRLSLTRPGHYGDLDMLQIGPLGKPNRAEVVFKPSPLTASEQYHQVSLWCILTQPLLLSCDITSMDEFDINLVTNDEVLAVNQDPLCKQGYRISNQKGSYEIWAKDLAGGDKAVALFNISEKDQILTFSAEDLGMSGKLRDLWRQRDIGILDQSFSSIVSSHGVLFLKISQERNSQ